MGSDVYDLDTVAGQNAFMLEALRRVAEGDRGQVIIDASTSSIGFNQTYVFRPGDTLFAILIPNSDFATALTAFTNNPSHTDIATRPLTSLTRGDGSQSPFYSNQYASLGTGTNAYAIEDRVVGVSNPSLIDYQDLIFKAVGLSQAANPLNYNIPDPVAFYRADPYWERGPDGRTETGLHARLTSTGIIPADTPLR